MWSQLYIWHHKKFPWWQKIWYVFKDLQVLRRTSVCHLVHIKCWVHFYQFTCIPVIHVTLDELHVYHLYDSVDFRILLTLKTKVMDYCMIIHYQLEFTSFKFSHNFARELECQFKCMMNNCIKHKCMVVIISRKRH